MSDVIKLPVCFTLLVRKPNNGVLFRQNKYKMKQRSDQPVCRIVDPEAGGRRQEGGGRREDAAVCRSTFLFKVKQSESKERRSDGADRVLNLITSPWTEPI